MERVKKNIFQRAAEWGIPFGLYLASTGTSAIYADLFPPLSAIFLVLLLGSPLVTYYFQRRKFIEDDGFTDYSSLWMLGILLFILGTVLASCIIFVVLQYLRPGYIYETAQAAIDAYSKMPEMKGSEFLVLLREIVEQKMLPTPIEAVFNAFWFITFCGSITSAITALFAGRRLKKRSGDI